MMSKLEFATRYMNRVTISPNSNHEEALLESHIRLTRIMVSFLILELISGNVTGS